MEEKRKKLIKIGIWSLFAILIITAIVLAGVNLSIHQKLEEAEKNNNEITQQLENLEEN